LPLNLLHHAFKLISSCHLHLVVNNNHANLPLQVSSEDYDHLDVDVAQLLYSGRPALRSLQEMQVFLYFVDEDIMNEWGIYKDYEMAAQAPWKLYGYQVKETLIFQRAMSN
jgi:hypothetical protein